MKISTVIIISIIAAIVIILSAFYMYAMDSPYRISSEDAKKRIQYRTIDVVLDVRTDLEVSTLGKYPGSVHIQSGDLEKMLPMEVPDKKARILAYCNSGQRARLATEKMHRMGYENAVYIAGGYWSLL